MLIYASILESGIHSIGSEIRKISTLNYKIKISFRMCSIATVDTTNSTTNRTMILESLVNSYLDFLKWIFKQLYQTEGFTNSIRDVRFSNPRHYKSV